MATDETLVLRAQKGDAGALNSLLDRYQHRVYTFAYRMMCNHADASDAAQEALVKIFIHLQKFRGDSAFSTWLFRLVVNTCRDELRRRRRMATESLDATYETDCGTVEREVSHDEDGPEALAQRQEVRIQVHSAIGQLREDYRELVLLRELQDLSYREISEITGLSVGTIKSRLHRARRSLRSILRGTSYSRQDRRLA